MFLKWFCLSSMVYRVHISSEKFNPFWSLRSERGQLHSFPLKNRSFVTLAMASVWQQTQVNLFVGVTSGYDVIFGYCDILLQNASGFYYNMRQLYYNMRQFLQNSTFTTKCKMYRYACSIIYSYLLHFYRAKLKKKKEKSATEKIPYISGNGNFQP